MYVHARPHAHARAHAWAYNIIGQRKSTLSLRLKPLIRRAVYGLTEKGLRGVNGLAILFGTIGDDGIIERYQTLKVYVPINHRVNLTYK